LQTVPDSWRSGAAAKSFKHKAFMLKRYLNHLTL
jgi:hypothetical protein